MILCALGKDSYTDVLQGNVKKLKSAPFIPINLDGCGDSFGMSVRTYPEYINPAIVLSLIRVFAFPLILPL